LLAPQDDVAQPLWSLDPSAGLQIQRRVRVAMVAAESYNVTVQLALDATIYTPHVRELFQSIVCDGCVASPGCVRRLVNLIRIQWNRRSAALSGY
jgi:hypothetical protein